jgi:hypothetical protein
LTYPQLNGREHILIQSVSVDLVQDSLEYIEYSFDRLDSLISELSCRAFYGGYQMQIVIATS